MTLDGAGCEPVRWSNRRGLRRAKHKLCLTIRLVGVPLPHPCFESATSAPLGLGVDPMPSNKHPVTVAVTLVVAVLATIGFVYINSVIASRSVAFLLALDLASWSGLATGAGVLALLLYFLYIINYPEGQSVSDAISQRGRNNKTL